MDPSSYFRKDDFHLSLHTKDARPLVTVPRRAQNKYRLPNVDPEIPGEMFMAYKFIIPDQLNPHSPTFTVQDRPRTGRGFWQVALVKLLIGNKFSNGTDCVLGVRYVRRRQNFLLLTEVGQMDVDELIDALNTVKQDPDYQHICPVDPLIPEDFTIIRNVDTQLLEILVNRHDLHLTFNERLADKLGFDPYADFHYGRIRTSLRLASMDVGDQQLNVACDLIESSHSGRRVGGDQKVMDTFVRPINEEATGVDVLDALDISNPTYHRLAIDGDPSSFEIVFKRDDGVVMLLGDLRPNDICIRLHFRRYETSV